MTTPQGTTHSRLRALLPGAIAAVMAVSAVDAQDRSRSDEQKTPITITGCVRAGVEADTFMLMNVREIDAAHGAQSVPADEFGRDVLYALNSSKGLKELLGRRVEVIGTVDLSDSHDTQIKVTADQSQRKDQVIEIKGDGAKVTVATDTKPAVAPDADATPTTSTEPNRLMYRLDVESIRPMSSEPCNDRKVVFRRPPA